MPSKLWRRLAAVLAAAVLAAGCANVRTGPAEYAVAYHDGLIEKRTQEGCYGPGEKKFTGVADKVITVPADKRNWVFSTQQLGQTEQPRQFTAAMADNVPMIFEGAVDMKFYGPHLCDLVNEVRTKYDLGSGGGRQAFLDIEFGTAVDAAFTRVAKRYGWAEVFENRLDGDDRGAQERFADEVAVEVMRVMNERLAVDDVLCGPDVKPSTDPEEAGPCVPVLITLTRAEPPAQCGDRPDCIELTERRQVEEQARAEADANIARAMEQKRAAEESRDAAVAQAQADQARLEAQRQTAEAQARVDNAACTALGLVGDACAQWVVAQALLEAARSDDFPDVLGGEAAVIVGGQP